MPAGILHLLGTAQPEGSGIARIVADLAANLDPAKFHVHAWFLGPSGPLVEDLRAAGATVRSVGWWRGARDPLGAWRFWRGLRNCDFALVHQHFGARSVRRLIRMSSDARIVVHVHGRIIATQRDSLALRGVDTVIACSHAVARDLAALRPIVVHAGVHSSEEVDTEVKAARTTTTIGAASRLVPRKGLMGLIRSVASLQLEFPDVRLEIAGTGPERENLEREAGRLGLTGRVRFLGWQRDLRPILRTWDIFAMPSQQSEGLPIAALEAMAEGLPIVATSVSGLPEIIDDGYTGYLVAPSDAEAFSKCMRLLVLDPKRRQVMGAAGKIRAREHFSVDRMVAEIAHIYDSLSRQPDGQART